MVALLLIAALFCVSACSTSTSNDAEGSPTDKRELNIEAACEGNILSSRYDVDLYVDDEKIGNVKHGSEGTYSVNLESGNHVFQAREKDGSAKGTKEFEMPEDNARLSCRVKCTSNSIEIGDFTVQTTGQAQPSDENAADAESTAREQEEREAAEAEAREKEEADAKTAAERAELEANGVKTPRSKWDYLGTDWNEAVDALSAAGFESVSASPTYDLANPNGGIFAGRPNDIKEISIDGSSSFNEGDLFEKSVPVVIVYHAWKYDDPSLSYNSYTVADLLNELEGNAMRAKDAHKNELVQLEGYIASFDASGSYVTVGTSDRWSFDDVRCDIETDEQKAILSDHSVGDYICLQGKITMVGELLGYSMDIHRIL